MAQTLHLINGDTVEGKIARSPVVANLLKQRAAPEAIIDELYIRALSRMPSVAERKKHGWI